MATDPYDVGKRSRINLEFPSQRQVAKLGQIRYKITIVAQQAGTAGNHVGNGEKARLNGGVRGESLIDLHCHLLPGIDDGPASLEISLEMARIASRDGITVIACTPHILPTVYDNNGPAIKAAVTVLQNELAQAGFRFDWSAARTST